MRCSICFLALFSLFLSLALSASLSFFSLALSFFDCVFTSVYACMLASAHVCVCACVRVCVCVRVYMCLLHLSGLVSDVEGESSQRPFRHGPHGAF